MVDLLEVTEVASPGTPPHHVPHTIHSTEKKKCNKYKQVLTDGVGRVGFPWN